VGSRPADRLVLDSEQIFLIFLPNFNAPGFSSQILLMTGHDAWATLIRSANVNVVSCLHFTPEVHLR